MFARDYSAQLPTLIHHRIQMLASLDGLDDRPVSEHAVVFEQAHEQLRAALEPDRESA